MPPLPVLPIDYTKASATKRRAVRDAYVLKQYRLCWHCGLSLDAPPPVQTVTLRLALFPPGFMNNPIHLHHDHKTGMTIGTVHAYCNGVLWQEHRQ